MPCQLANLNLLYCMRLAFGITYAAVCSEAQFWQLARFVEATCTTCLKQAIGSRVRVVEAPGPGVVRLQVAITGVASTAEGLKPYQLVPMAFVATMVVDTVAGAPQQAKLLVEARVTDSTSGDVLAKVVRTHTGERLQRVASNMPVITFESVKPIMDSWCDSVSKSVAQYVKPR